MVFWYKMYCKRCNKKIDKDSKFCKYCGLKLNNTIDIENNSDICHECGYAIIGNQKFCSECGINIKKIS